MVCGGRVVSEQQLHGHRLPVGVIGGLRGSLRSTVVLVSARVRGTVHTRYLCEQCLRGVFQADLPFILTTHRTRPSLNPPYKPHQTISYTPAQPQTQPRIRDVPTTPEFPPGFLPKFVPKFAGALYKNVEIYKKIGISGTRDSLPKFYRRFD